MESRNYPAFSPQYQEDAVAKFLFAILVVLVPVMFVPAPSLAQLSPRGHWRAGN